MQWRVLRRVGLTATLLAVLAAAALLIVPGDRGPTASRISSPSPVPALASGLDLIAVVPSTAASIPSLPPVTLPAPTLATAPPSPSPAATSAGIPATRIRVDRLGIDLPIVQGDGIDAPLGKVAHYPTSAWPGAGSNIYLYAHARTGMFLALWQARAGDRVRLDLVDGTSRFYRVTRVLPRVPYNAMQYLAPTPTEQLTLQTCTAYEADAPRFVVIAVPAP